MESLIGYTSEDETGECCEGIKVAARRSGNQMETDDNYDNVQMDMSEDSNMVYSSDTSLSDASSEREDHKNSSGRYSDEDQKTDWRPLEKKDKQEGKKGKRSGLSDMKDKRRDSQDQPKEKSENWRARSHERKERTGEGKEGSNERKQRADVKREKLNDREIKLEDRKRKSEDTKRQDDRREMKPKRDEAGRMKEERSIEHCSKDSSDREPKPHRDSRERGVDDRRPKSREKYEKEGRRGDGRKEERKIEERRTIERKEERRPDDRYGEERKQSRKGAKRDRSRSPRRRGEEKVKSPTSHHSTKSRSPLILEKKNIGEKRGASPRRSDYKRSKYSPDHRRRSRSRDKHSPESRRRSRSRERSLGRPRQYEKKPSKLSILERLGIALPSVSDVAGSITPQELVQRSMQVQVQQVKSKTGIELPSYYNPAAMNPARYAEQIQKRRLLWGNKSNEPVAKTMAEAVPGPVQGNNWEGTTFAADQDGKMTAKFKRLMGIKNQGASSSCDVSSDGSKPEIIKKQEELFSSMEMQYEVARVATHTHRGLGLGFGTFQYPR